MRGSWELQNPISLNAAWHDAIAGRAQQTAYPSTILRKLNRQKALKSIKGARLDYLW